jgi:microcin C transport system substrate-binding protein
MDMTFAPLMVRAGDEPDAMYGLAAQIGAAFGR